jgi:very-short-patch-repair endonuclease
VNDPERDAPELAETGPGRIQVIGEDGTESWRQETADDRPDVRELYQMWLPTWQRWAGRERVRARQRRWHRDLFTIAGRLSQMDDEWELVLATGLLAWAAPDGTRVRNHLLVTRVHVEVDPDTERVDVVLGETAPVLQDRELLGDLPSFTAARTDRLRERVREGEGVGLQDSVAELLQTWCDRALESPASYRPDWAPAEKAGRQAEVRLAPALVLRKRDQGSLIAYYDEMLATLTRPDAHAPLGLAQLVEPLEQAERMAFLRERDGGRPGALSQDPLFPLPANPEQSLIMTRLAQDNGVVVQGPPGTGKTHSIANLLSALLAQGQRVLVTSQKAQALRVLRDKLPEEIAGLCISMTDLGKGGSAELEGGVKALSSRFAGYDAKQQAKRIAEKRDQLHAARRTIAELTDRIRALRESETYSHPEIAPGYRGTLAEIVRRLKQEERVCSWMPTPMPAGAPDTPPIGVGEVAELAELLAQETPQRRERPAQRIPDVATLPTAEQVQALIANESAARSLASQAETEISAQLNHLDPALLSRLEEISDAVRSYLHRLDLTGPADEWSTENWAVRALADGIAGRESALWEQLAALEGRLADLRETVRRINFRQVTHPALESPAAAGAYLQAMCALRDYLAAGNRLKRGPALLRPAAQRAAEPYLDKVAVDGVSPSNPELLSIVIDDIEGRKIVAQLRRGWRAVGVEFPRDLPLETIAAQLEDAFGKLAVVRKICEAVPATARLLADAGVFIPLRTLADWNSYVEALRAGRLRLEAERATTELEELREKLEHQARLGTPAPELLEAIRAVAMRDAVTYRLCLTALTTAQHELMRQRRCDELAARIRETHPALLKVLAEAGEWQPYMSSWERAWAWAKAETFFREQRQPGLEQRLEAELEAAVARTMRITAELAAEQAWDAALSRMNAHQTMALRSYEQHMAKRGKGTGKHGARYQARAREAMADALGAVPAWIMPIQQVLDTIPPKRDSFDVIIVDEASQASIDALFLLWLAPRVIVVGDDKQCAPSAVTHGELDPIFKKLATYLPDMPAYLRDAFTPKSSLFDLLRTRFGGLLRLKEHFRCMPEIIEFSSRQFYSDEPLVPLRQFGADRLQPLKVVRVTGAYTEGRDTRLRNRVEAEAIVDRIRECIADPAYDGKTFGVVVLQGTEQSKLIHNMLLERLETKEWEKRRLRVGTPPDFQGDERDVIFLSMVIAEKRQALTSTEWQRRYNVAASRAKDQMWLFHSVSPDLLSPDCLRRSLLTYMLTPPPVLGPKPLADVRPDEPHPAFDSLFEQRVFLRIRERGYHVVPQFEVNGRRIDLVVSGAQGRLAVECDGDFWHGPEQRDADLARERELKRAGWRFWRVRESEFYFDPDAALAPLWDELDRRGIRPGEVLTDGASAAESTWSAVPLASHEGWDGLEDDDLADEGPISYSAPALSTIAAASPTRTSAAKARSAVGGVAGGRSAEIRLWARENGFAVRSRGRLPEEVIEAYNRAHSTD